MQATVLVGNDFDKAELISFIHSNFGHFALYKGHTVDFLEYSASIFLINVSIR